MKTKRAALGKAPPFWGGGGQLKVEPEAELHAPRRVRAGEVHEIRVAKGRADRTRAIAKLGVVEDVERFPLEVKAGPFIDGEALGKAKVEVEAAGQVQSVAPDVAERKSRGYTECGGIVKERSKRARLLI